MLRSMHRTVAVVAALGVAAAVPAGAEPGGTYEYKTPAVFVDTIDTTGVPRRFFDGQVIGGIGDLEPTGEWTRTAAGTAWAEASDDHFVVGAIGAAGSANAVAFHDFIVRDPAQRAFVKVSLASKIGFNATSGFKAMASTVPAANTSTRNNAYFRIMVFLAEPEGVVTIAPDLTTSNETWPVPASQDARVFVAAGDVESYFGAPDEYGDPPVRRNRWSKYQLLSNGEVLDYAEGDGLTVSLETRPTLLLRPGLTYIFALYASAGPTSAAVVDPLLEAHPDNPEVTIEFPDSVPNDDPAPIMLDLEPADLVALGIDPQPFVDIGFFPPSPDASPTSGATPLPTSSNAPTPAPTAAPVPTSRCDAAGADAARIAAIRARIALACSCESFDGTKGRKHGDYVRCATSILKAAVDAGDLRKTCQGAVKACAAKSTCGKPGAVTCRRTTSRNKTTCAIKNDARACTAPKGGAACVGSATSCCDDCAAD